MDNPSNSSFSQPFLLQKINKKKRKGKNNTGGGRPKGPPTTPASQPGLFIVFHRTETEAREQVSSRGEERSTSPAPRLSLLYKARAAAAARALTLAPPVPLRRHPFSSPDRPPSPLKVLHFSEFFLKTAPWPGLDRLPAAATLAAEPPQPRERNAATTCFQIGRASCRESV